MSKYQCQVFHNWNNFNGNSICLLYFHYFIFTDKATEKYKISEQEHKYIYRKSKEKKPSSLVDIERIIWTFLSLSLRIVSVPCKLLCIAYSIHRSSFQPAFLPYIAESIDHKPLWSKYLPPLSQVICFVIFHWKMHLPSIISLQLLRS